MADKLNVLVICGSLRKGSFNAAVARALPALAPPEMALTPAASFGKFPIYNADDQTAHRHPRRRRRLVRRHPQGRRRHHRLAGIQLVDPGRLEERHRLGLARKTSLFKDKPMALQSASGGQVGGARMQYHLRMALTSIGAQMFGKPEVFVNFAAKKIDEKGELNDQAVKDVIKLQLAAFAKFIARVRVK